MLLRSCSLMVSVSSSISLFVFCLIVLSVVESGLFNSSSYCGLILINNNNNKNKCTYFSLCWVCVAVHRLSPDAVSGLLAVGASLIAEHRL